MFRIWIRPTFHTFEMISVLMETFMYDFATGSSCLSINSAMSSGPKAFNILFFLRALLNNYWVGCSCIGKIRNTNE